MNWNGRQERGRQRSLLGRMRRWGQSNRPDFRADPVARWQRVSDLMGPGRQLCPPSAGKRRGLHHQRRRVILRRVAGMKPIQGNDARVVQTQHDCRFAPEPAQSDGIFCRPLDFDNDVAAVLLIPTFVNNGKRAAAEGRLTECAFAERRHTICAGLKVFVAGNCLANKRACFHKKRSPKKH